MTGVIAVANLKGGVAKTTTAVSLGGALVEQGFSVLLIDLDSQGNLTQAMGVDAGAARQSVTDVFFNLVSLASVSRGTSVQDLDLVAANSGMELAERFLPIRRNFEMILHDSIAHLPGYDYVVLDCPPSTGAVTLNALNAADQVVIPLSPELFSLPALNKMITMCENVRSTSNPNLFYRLLLTMVDIRLKIHRNLREELSLQYGDLLFQTEIQIDTRLRDCTYSGLPITHYASQSRAAQQYRSLAQELMGIPPKNLFEGDKVGKPNEYQIRS